MKPIEQTQAGGGTRVHRAIPSAPRRRRRQGGFTLIEVLVSLVVISVGILGVTAMQTASLSSGVLTRTLDSCSALASDALDRIYTNHSSWADYVGGAMGGVFRVSPAEGNNPPGGAALNDYNDLYQSMVDMQLSDAALEVTFDTDVPLTGLNTVTATLYWDHRGDNKQCVVQSVMPR
ncbi:MAG: prepilin-type N-terminal cleavage/methylation domain-containing protein [Nitrospinae bacterium]|nr:prepilin-type N-terminal cleavage/methylation domain-containing protein [Nitrospinota bacterium]